MCLAGNSQEDLGVIGSIADLTVNANDIYRGYLIPVAAKKMGTKNFVHISFPRHMSYELLSRRRNIMEATCNDIGLKFHFEAAPDPVSEVGVAGAKSSYSKNTCMARKVREGDGIFLHLRYTYGTFD